MREGERGGPESAEVASETLHPFIIVTAEKERERERERETGGSCPENQLGSTKVFEMSAFICARAGYGTASQKQLSIPKEQKQVI